MADVPFNLDLSLISGVDFSKITQKVFELWVKKQKQKQIKCKINIVSKTRENPEKKITQVI